MSPIKIDKIVRSKRKTVALMVMADATLVVRAPMRTPLYYINDLVAKNRLWIKKRKDLAIRENDSYEAKEFVDGEEFLYLGDRYKLKLSDDKQIELNDRLIFPRDFLSCATGKMIEWYKVQALKVISERVVWYSRMTGWEYKSVRISNAKTRWGSCGATGSLNFSWRLIMAPPKIVDYLVVHELAHLKHRNHSAKYWNTVSAILPDYKERDRWLKDNGRSLNL
ncbi:M48 family metallopeptidase [Thermodesulfobacteriota bacterium]